MHNPTKPSRTNAKKDNPTKKGGAGSRHPTPPERNERDVSLTTVKFYWVVVGYVKGLVALAFQITLDLFATTAKPPIVKVSGEHPSCGFSSKPILYGRYILKRSTVCA